MWAVRAILNDRLLELATTDGRPISVTYKGKPGTPAERATHRGDMSGDHDQVRHRFARRSGGGAPPYVRNGDE